MFEKQRISDFNIKEYLGTTDTPCKKQILSVPQLLQNDYGEACDCTLTSITAVIKFFRYDYKVEDIYNWVEKIAKAYGYKSLQGFGINDYVPYSRYLKGLCYDYEIIKREIDYNKPILLNLWKDGRDFYKNHTVLIIGYLYINNKRMLIVQDNWYRTISYIDYDLLSAFSSVQILT